MRTGPRASPCPHAHLPRSRRSGLETRHLGPWAGAELTSGSFEQARLHVPQHWALYPFALKLEHVPSSGPAGHVDACVTGSAVWASRPEGPEGELAGQQDHLHSRAAQRPAPVRPSAEVHLMDGGRGCLLGLPPPQTQHRSGRPPGPGLCCGFCFPKHKAHARQCPSQTAVKTCAVLIQCHEAFCFP